VKAPTSFGECDRYRQHDSRNNIALPLPPIFGTIQTVLRRKRLYDAIFLQLTVNPVAR
jgi:hypothetical protein